MNLPELATAHSGVPGHPYGREFATLTMSARHWRRLLEIPVDSGRSATLSLMPDASLGPALASAGGAVAAVVATMWGTTRRESALSEREHNRLSLEARQVVYSDLMAPAMELRVQIDLAGQRAWRDMDVKLTAIDENVRLLGQHASRVAVLAPAEVAESARALISAATALAARALRNAEMTYEPGLEARFLIGEIRAPLDFGDFDRCLTRMYEVIEIDLDKVKTRGADFRADGRAEGAPTRADGTATPDRSLSRRGARVRRRSLFARVGSRHVRRTAGPVRCRVPRSRPCRFPPGRPRTAAEWRARAHGLPVFWPGVGRYAVEVAQGALCVAEVGQKLSAGAQALRSVALGRQHAVEEGDRASCVSYLPERPG